jgi:hypothetical protein
MLAYLRIAIGGLLTLEQVKVINSPASPEQETPES